MSFLLDPALLLRQRQTAGLLVKRLALQSSVDVVGPIVTASQDPLLLALADAAPQVQTAVSMVLSTALKMMSLSRWPTLLERIALLAAAGEAQSRLPYFLGVSRCLQVIFEDCSGEMASLCEDPLQLSSLCDILEKCVRAVSFSSTTALHDLGLVATVWRACEALFVSGVVPQSSNMWSSSGGSSGQFGFADTDDDSSDDDGLMVKGTSPMKNQQQKQQPQLSRGQKKIRREQILRRLRMFVDVSVDSLRMFVPNMFMLGGSAPRSSSFSTELAAMNLITQLIGFWDRAGRFVGEVLPILLEFVQVVSTSKNGLTADCSPIQIVIVDLITELAQDHEANGVVESNLASVVNALLTVSLLTHDEVYELMEGESNAHEPDDERRVLLSMSRRGVSLLASAQPKQQNLLDVANEADDGDVEEQLEHGGESEGAMRDSVAWCWNCLAVSLPEELTTTLIPVLVQATMTATQQQPQQPLMFEAVLYTLSELIDELFVHIPQEILTAFLQQCESVLLRNDGSSTFAAMGAYAAIRRQSICCLERAAVGCLTASGDDCDGDDYEDGAPTAPPVVNPSYVLGILLQFISDDNKKVQLAAIRGVENVVIHSLRKQIDQDADDENDDFHNNNKIKSSTGNTTTTTTTTTLSAELLQQFYIMFVDLTRRQVLQVRSHAALCHTIGRIVEVDAEASTRVFFSSTGADGQTLATSVIHVLISAIHGALVAPLRQATQTQTVMPGRAARALASMSALCDSLEQLDPAALLSTTQSPSGEPVSVLFLVWSMVQEIIAQHMNSSNAVAADIALFHEEIIALALDCVSATCDVFDNYANDDDNNDDAASSSWDEVVPQAFASTTVASTALALLKEGLLLNPQSSMEPNLRRAAFGLLGDFVTCGAAVKCSVSGVLDDMFMACVMEAIPNNSTNLQQQQERWGAMDARSNALFCFSHLVRMCCGDSSQMIKHFPTFSAQPTLQITAVRGLLQQLDSGTVNNIHRTMKLNILLAVSSLVPLIADLVLTEFGVDAISALVKNASYYLASADDPEEVLAVLDGIGTFLQHAAARSSELVMSVLQTTEGRAAIARLSVQLSKKAIFSYHCDSLPTTTALWREISVAVLRSIAVPQKWNADELRITKKEATWLLKFVS
ncbi:Hypothetical protein, putative [Bodo saltans]|uniref:Uncharacterized protein n=1 Tax=Bodo saltans TaxID=75058 RepID=A0A0S4JTM1_BODSA|nr:Hypothetical protein, putative [Bodo saltans]|eukprot:CUG92473.1 Hypothetical protein, putative [Bodo saltans]